MSPEQVARVREKIAKVVSANLQEEIKKLLWTKSINDMLTNSLIAAGVFGTAGYLSGQRDSDSQVPVAPDKQIMLPVLAELTSEPKEEKKVKQAVDDWWQHLPFLRNTRTDNPDATPGAILAQYALPATAAYAAWRTGNLVANKQRRTSSQDELSKAKQEYEAALTKLFPAAKEKDEKSASELSVDDMLDEIFEKLSLDENANPILAAIDRWVPFASFFPETQGKALGNYALYALPAAITGYHLVDTAMQGHNRNVILQKAVEERERRRAAARPAPLRVTLTPKRLADDDQSE